MAITAKGSGQTSSKKKPGGYSYNNTSMNKLYDEIMNRKDFTFDLNSNALYNSLKDNYQKDGQMAMMDTIGQASAMTGGYGNSYAASAGQQAYQQNLDKLNERVPEIYQLALEQYQLESQNLLDRYGLAVDERNFDYQQHRDSVADSQWQEEFDYTKQHDQKEYDYRAYRDSVSDSQWQKEFDYTKKRDKIEDIKWKQEFAYNKKMDAKEYALKVKELTESIRQFNLNYKLSEKEFNEMCRQWAKEYDLDARALAEDIRQYNASLAEDQRQFNATLAENQRQADLDYDIQKKKLAEQEAARVAAEEAARIEAEEAARAAAEEDDYAFEFPASGENGDFSEADYAKMDKIMANIDELGYSGDKAKMKKYLNDLVADNAIGLAMHIALKELLEIS